jgi:hypothetical protein
LCYCQQDTSFFIIFRYTKKQLKSQKHQAPQLDTSKHPPVAMTVEAHSNYIPVRDATFPSGTANGGGGDA